MRIRWLIALPAVSVPLHAKPVPLAAGDKLRPPWSQIFIVPSGKPFRAPPGDPNPLAAWFTAADTNHDRKNDTTEFRADFQAVFNELDVDHDGRISSGEIARYEREVALEVQVGSTGLGAELTGGGRGGGTAGGHRHGSSGMSRGGMGGAGSSGGRGDDTRGAPVATAPRSVWGVVPKTSRAVPDALASSTVLSRLPQWIPI